MRNTGWWVVTGTGVSLDRPANNGASSSSGDLTMSSLRMVWRRSQMPSSGWPPGEVMKRSMWQESGPVVKKVTVAVSLMEVTYRLPPWVTWLMEWMAVPEGGAKRWRKETEQRCAAEASPTGWKR